MNLEIENLEVVPFLSMVIWRSGIYTVYGHALLKKPTNCFNTPDTSNTQCHRQYAGKWSSLAITVTFLPDNVEWMRPFSHEYFRVQVSGGTASFVKPSGVIK